MRDVTEVEQGLEPEVMSYCISQLFRIRRVGATLLVEQSHVERKVERGEEQRSIAWKVAAVVRPERGQTFMQTFSEAMKWMLDADAQVLTMIREDRKNAVRSGNA